MGTLVANMKSIVLVIVAVAAACALDSEFCLHKEDTIDHKCFEACAKSKFQTKGIDQQGKCPTKYNTVDKTTTQEQCPDGVTNTRYCAATKLKVSVATKGEQ